MLCTGKIYYDLVGHPSRQDNEAVAIGRVELLYPFPEAQILELVNSYPNLREVVWVQEEPRNMGARAHMSPRLMQILPQHAGVRLHRPPRARVAGRGLPRRPHRRAEPHPAHRAGPRPARHPLSGEAAGRSLSVALPRAVVFDLDDTLLDTTGLEAEMLVGLCAAVNEELPGVEFGHLRERYRDGRDHLYERVLSGEIDIAAYRRLHLIAVCEPWGEPSEALHATATRLRDEQLERARFVEHAIELLRQLREAGVRTGLLTNGPSWMQRRKVELLGLEEQLDAIGISEELGASKPDPAAFTATLELMGSAPDHTVMVGDHLDWDVRGALAAGMRGAVWVAGDEDEREPPPGAMKVARLGDVPAALAALA